MISLIVLYAAEKVHGDNVWTIPKEGTDTEQEALQSKVSLLRRVLLATRVAIDVLSLAKLDCPIGL